MKTINQLLLLLFITIFSSCTMSKDMSYEDDIYSTDNGVVFADYTDEEQNNNEQEDYYDSQYGDLYEDENYDFSGNGNTNYVTNHNYYSGYNGYTSNRCYSSRYRYSNW